MKFERNEFIPVFLVCKGACKASELFVNLLLKKMKLSVKAAILMLADKRLRSRCLDDTNFIH